MLVRHMGGHIGHEQDELEERADEDDGDLLRSADADVEDEQRDHGADRQIADEVDHGLHERLHYLE